MMHVGECGSGWTRIVVSAKASLIAVKAAVALSSQANSCLSIFGGKALS